jgi:predicted phosphodiesterase
VRASRFAVIADVHGNAWALEAVLEDIERRGIRNVVNLGDCFYGPLEPGRTLELLRGRGWPTVRGNQDRALLEDAGPSGGGPTLSFVRQELGNEGIDWLTRATSPPFSLGEVLGCHGTPERDDVYLAEIVTPAGVRLRDPDELDRMLGVTDARGILCGHSHVPRLLHSRSGRWILNPGSVGLPAFEDDTPFPHAMVSGSPHARYAVVELEGRDPRVLHLSVDYDVAAAASAARRRGREDWGHWLTLGAVT